MLAERLERERAAIPSLDCGRSALARTEIRTNASKRIKHLVKYYVRSSSITAQSKRHVTMPAPSPLRVSRCRVWDCAKGRFGRAVVWEYELWEGGPEPGAACSGLEPAGAGWSRPGPD